MTTSVLLARRGLSVLDLANILGMSYSNLHARLSRQVPSRDTAEQVATGLGMSLDEFQAAIHEEWTAARKEGWEVDFPRWFVEGVESIPGGAEEVNDG